MIPKPRAETSKLYQKSISEDRERSFISWQRKLWSDYSHVIQLELCVDRYFPEPRVLDAYVHLSIRYIQNLPQDTMPFSHHSHSGEFCPSHAQNTLEQVIQTAILQGMEVFCLSEHMPRSSDELYEEEVGLIDISQFAFLSPF